MAYSNLLEFNGVSRENQVDQPIWFAGTKNGSPRIMFVGNSITIHGRLESIGWYGNWGMAASSPEKDYVHIFMNSVTQKYPEASFCLVQASCWESDYKEINLKENFSEAIGFEPDVIICSISANINEDEFDNDLFKLSLKKLHTFLSGKNTKIIEASSFFGSEKKNKAICEYVEENDNVVLAYVTDILQDKSNSAIGLFEHGGIQAHPGDSGMKLIADRFLEKFYEIYE